ncbi:hypothetical protein SPSIL_020090 [Sporomusa silvacetica DSM 10669]|uniref:Uncharacterized protein n=1 Tax=Sporomusa silvacetica DSM 10669 TaxID=1123289 RepID=A0ABZ3IK60_9FIRM|nr:hypothetical protein [Sporomusa silvacetica]OZC18738.1 hypothetical protein SPSIL_23470 [Sporomusa silvacetica DSM 10669]
MNTLESIMEFKSYPNWVSSRLQVAICNNVSPKDKYYIQNYQESQQRKNDNNGCAIFQTDKELIEVRFTFKQTIVKRYNLNQVINVEKIIETSDEDFISNSDVQYKTVIVEFINGTKLTLTKPEININDNQKKYFEIASNL